MDTRTLQLLQTVDDPKHCEHPPGFDWRAAFERVQAIKPELERLVGHAFVIDRNVQDASFLTDLSWQQTSERVTETVIAVRFSSFGNLFTIWSSRPPEQQPSEAIVQRIIEFTEKCEFVYVDTETLDEPYTGENRAFAGQTWWHRFFDYI